MDSMYLYSDLEKLAKLPIQQAVAKLIIGAQYAYMDGEVGYDTIDFLLEAWNPDWEYFKSATGHDIQKEIENNKERYDRICYYTVTIQMVEYNKLAWGIYDDFSAYKNSAKTNS